MGSMPARRQTSGAFTKGSEAAPTMTEYTLVGSIGAAIPASRSRFQKFYICTGWCVHREAGCRHGAASSGFLVASVTRARGPCRSTGVIVAAETFEAAYRRHSGELIRYATVLVGPDDASDVVIDAMVRVFASDASTVSNLRAFLFRAVHHHAVDHQRAGSRRRRREASYQAQRADVTVDPVAADARAALGVLSVQQRTVVFLTYWVDQTPADIAQVIGVSEGTIRKQLARARARLREVLDD